MIESGENPFHRPIVANGTGIGAVPASTPSVAIGTTPTEGTEGVASATPDQNRDRASHSRNRWKLTHVGFWGVGGVSHGIWRAGE
jgi:hypothetical protein